MSDKGSPTQTIRQGQSNTRCQTRAVQHKMSDKGSPTQISDKGSPTQDVRQGQSNTRCQTKVVQHRRQTAVPKDGEVMGGGGERGGGCVGGGLPEQIKTAARKGRRTTEVIHAHDGSPSTTLPNRCTVTSLYRQLWTPARELCYRPPSLPPLPQSVRKYVASWLRSNQPGCIAITSGPLQRDAVLLSPSCPARSCHCERVVS